MDEFFSFLRGYFFTNLEFLKLKIKRVWVEIQGSEDKKGIKTPDLRASLILYLSNINKMIQKRKGKNDQ